MKRFFSILLLSFSFILPSSAQRNYAQELINLMQQGRCFEARELYTQYADKLPLNDKAYTLFFNWNMAQFFNKPDSAAIYMEELLANHEMFLGPGTGEFYGRQLWYYSQKQEFEKGLKVCDNAIGYLNRNPFDLGYNIIQNEIREVEKIKASLKYRAENEPRFRMERNPRNKNKAIKIKDDKYILFDANYNGIQIETLLHTEVSTEYFLITQKLADQIGVKVIDKNQDSINIYGIQTKSFRGIVDSIGLGSIKLYNVPVMVLDKISVDHFNKQADSIGEKKIQINDNRIIMRVTAMKLIGKVEFNWSKKPAFSFPENIKEAGNNDMPNFFVYEGYPYVRLKINELACTASLNTFNNCFLKISPLFYEKNKSRIEIEPVPIENHNIVKDAKIYFDGGFVTHNNDEVSIMDKPISDPNTRDGQVGINFLKRLGSKVILDFNNMRIDVAK